MKILLIEDNPGDILLMKEMLKDQKLLFNLVVASRLEEGLALIFSEKPTIILLDMTLPDSYGLNTFERVYRVAIQTPIILLTGNIDKETALTAVKKGAQDYLVKGNFNGELLKRAIDYAIERKGADNKRHHHQSQLAAVDLTNSVSEIVLTFAHELTQPLSAIVLYMQGCIGALRSANKPAAEIILQLQNVLQQANKASEILHRLKNFLYQREFFFETISLNQLVIKIVESLHQQIQITVIDIQLDFDETLPAIKVDAAQIRYVILNLIRNAAEQPSSSKNKNPQLLVRTFAIDHLYVGLQVINQDLQFTPQQIEQLFEPSHNNKISEIELRLAISRTLIEAHAGRLEIKPHLPQGTCFQFKLPIKA